MAKRKITTPTKAKAAAAKAAKAPKVEAKAKAPVEKTARPSGGITRTAATVTAARYPFGHMTDRDVSYLRFYKSIAVAGKFSVESIIASGKAPEGAHSSNRPHDAGVLTRLVKAGMLTVSNGGKDFALTALGTGHK